MNFSRSKTRHVLRRRFAGLLLALLAGSAQAHDPVFGLGPHVLYQGGVEISPGLHEAKRGDARTTELDLELVYGITGDWAAGIELSRVRQRTGQAEVRGGGDPALFTKYRFWRDDRPGVQESAALFLRLEPGSGAAGIEGNGSTDGIAGLAWGYESRKWYRWASLRYRRNGVDDAGLRRGEKLLLDLVGGFRPHPGGYLEPDTVWLLELNGEYGARAERNGQRLADSGGSEWFLSPGIFWTLRNFAVKAGVQIPVASNLNGGQAASDYRLRLILEWHL